MQTFPKNPKRIMIFGRPGSGKSTFSLQLHKATGLPLYHLDKHFFTLNWVERDYQEFLAIQQDIIDRDTWIIDGNSTQSLGMRFARADLVIYFNFSKWLCLFRLFKRFFDKNRGIDDRAEGCQERISLKFFYYMWIFEKRVAKQLQNFEEKYPNAHFVAINNPQDLLHLKSRLLSKPRILLPEQEKICEEPEFT